jgi:predicted porin
LLASPCSNNTAGASQPETGASIWAVGWEHLFSKTTKVYVDYARTDNDANSAFAVSSSGRGDAVTPGAGGDPQAWSIGMIVNF